MPVAEEPQHMQALARANELRLGRSVERKELRGAPAERIEAALLNPTDALATFTLGRLLAPSNHGAGIIPRFGKVTLVRSLNQLTSATPGRAWNTETRLRDLTERERRQLVAILHPYLHGPES